MGEHRLIKQLHKLHIWSAFSSCLYSVMSSHRSHSMRTDINHQQEHSCHDLIGAFISGVRAQKTLDVTFCPVVFTSV